MIGKLKVSLNLEIDFACESDNPETIKNQVEQHILDSMEVNLNHPLSDFSTLEVNSEISVETIELYKATFVKAE
jgi:hypothetical protein